MPINIPSHLTDGQWVEGLKWFARLERAASAELIAHLVELEVRELHLAAGFRSLFAYCCEELHLSEDEAFNRIEAARTARRFPVILDMLAEGELSVTTARLVGKILTNGNHQDVLSAAKGQSKRAVEELLVRYAPRPDVPTTIRRTPTPAAPTVTSSADVVSSAPTSANVCDASPAQAPLTTAAPRPAHVTPLAPSRYELRMTVTQDTREKLLLAQDLLRHAIPSGNMSEILDRALALLLEDVLRKKFAATPQPRVPRGSSPDSRDPTARSSAPSICETWDGARRSVRVGTVATHGRSSNSTT